MSTISTIRKTYHIVNPNERPRKHHESKRAYDGYFHDIDPGKLSNRSLRDHLCEPWFGCHQCDMVCAFGVEYMRRVSAGEIEPLTLWEVTMA